MKRKNPKTTWPSTTLDSEASVFEVLTELRGKRWLCRGQSRRYRSLVPSMDRHEKRRNLSRAEKLTLERKSINLFRSNVQFFAGAGEKEALTDDITALLVLRHYGVPSRILDWTHSPWVAASFAAESNGTEDGELWCFDEPLYEKKGNEQWKWWPETTTDESGDGPKFDANLTAFSLEEPPDWFVCYFYRPGFPRQKAQHSAYSMTARFGHDHAQKIAELLEWPDSYHLYIIPAALKPKLRKILREDHDIWRGSLFPDSAGAAQTVKDEVFPEED